MRCLPRSFRRFALPVAALVGVGAMSAWWSVVHAQRATRAALGGPDRYLTALSTDKPIYRPGEQVLVRGVMLHAFTRVPLRQPATPRIDIKGPRGETVAGGTAQLADGVWSFGWTIPAAQAGGEYTVKVEYPWHGHPPAERKFDVRVFRAPRLKSQIVFLRDGYGPGDKVTATLDVKRAEGGVPAGAKVTATARVDGAEVAVVSGTVDARGLCTVSFALPRHIERGEGSLGFAIEDGGVVETAAKTIPILVQTLDLQLFPEGGELVAGVKNRVYFQARTPARKPADLTGVIVDQQGQEVARVRSEHEGRGRFELLPEAGARYRLRVLRPSGIRTTWPLPAAKEGVALRARTDVVGAGAPVRLLLASATARTVKVTVSHREREVGVATVALPGGPEPIEVSVPVRAGDGVLIATAWSEQGRPLAERLVFRRPAKALRIELRTDKKSYVPGDTVALTARATRGGKPVSAILGLTVTDDAVLELIERREQAPQLPVMMLLEPEVRDLADAHVYLDPRNAKAPLALDLLLGTQGWRRFALMDIGKLLGSDDGRRALAYTVPVAIARPPVLRKAGRALAVDEGEADQALLPRAAARPQAIVPRAAAAAPPQAMPVPVAAPAPVRPVAPVMVPPAAPPPGVAPVRAEPRAFAAEAPEEAPVEPVAGGAKAKQALARMRGRPSVRELLRQVPARQDLVYVREYAHKAVPERKPTDRVDFTETLYFHAGVRTDAQTGEVTVRFALNDAVTSFKARASGFSDDGALGEAATLIESVQPFYLEPKLPLEVTSGDLVRLPVNLVNGTSEPLKAARLEATAPQSLRLGSLPKLDLGPRERARGIVELAVGAPSANPIELALTALAGDFTDTVKRTLIIKPNGFPFQRTFGGMTVAGGGLRHTITIPEGVVAGSVRTSVAVYPTPLANMTQALARLIRDPNGCFEQTSSTSYPLTMAQQYFTTHTGVDPKLVAMAQEKLDAGYKRLTSFECTEKGYEWFGQNPGHEALTAYGLLHFSDMAKVREVDPAMLTRTREWLLKQRDGKGGFSRKRRALHTWVEDQDASNGYILWALLSAGDKGGDKALSSEIAAFRQAAGKSGNSYVAALGANVLGMTGDRPGARALMDRLAGQQAKDGRVEGATTSIVGSGGEALAIETTSLAVLAWLGEPAFSANVERAMKYLADSCQDGRYGSTQSTVLALRAIVAYDQVRARPKAAGELRLHVNGAPAGAPVRFDAGTEGVLQLPDIAPLLTAGTHDLELRMKGGAPMPYSVAVEYSALTPDSSPEAKVDLQLKLSKATLAEGELTEAFATITNRATTPVPTPIAIVGLPGGLEPRHDQLKELVKKGTIDAYEVLGREVVLYFRGLGAGQKVIVPLSLVAAVPGAYTGPASRAYLYYTDEHKTWVPGLKADIVPRAGRR